MIPEPKKQGVEKLKRPQGGDERFPHVKNFLDCMRSRQQPVENLEVGHHASSVAHLGNIALRAGRKIGWDPVAERIPGDAEADKLVGIRYREPWSLPYRRRT